MKSIPLVFIFLFNGLFFQTWAKKPDSTWRKLLREHADCVTWVSVTVRVELSAGGRSMPPQE